MATKKKYKAAKETVDEIMFRRPVYRKVIAESNVEDTLKHTRAVLERAQRKAKK